MRQNLKVILLLIKLRLSHMMVFRLSFFGAFFVDGAGFIVQLITFSAIYAHVDAIGTWTRAEMYVFIGTFSLINALNMVIYFFGVNTIPRKIVEGGLDHYITKPFPSLLRLTFESVNLGSIPLIPLSLLIIARGVALLPAAPALGDMLLYTVLVVLMTLLWYDVEVILRVVPFFSPSARSIEQAESLLELNFKIPGVLYKGFFKVLFYFVLPYGIMATVPTQALAQTLTLGGVCYAVTVVLLFTALALGLWRLGVRHYRSASS